MPRKYPYAARKIHQALRDAGFPGSEMTVSRYVASKRREGLIKKAYLPMEFDPGQDAQVHWGEAVVEPDGERRVAQSFIMCLSYSHARFVMPFPFQMEEAFIEGHIHAFHFFRAVPAGSLTIT